MIWNATIRGKKTKTGKRPAKRPIFIIEFSITPVARTEQEAREISILEARRRGLTEIEIVSLEIRQKYKP